MKTFTKSAILGFVLFVALHGNAYSQDAIKGVAIDVQMKAFHYVNRPALSVVSDGTDLYRDVQPTITVGYRYAGLLLGASYQTGHLYVNNDQLKEQMQHHMASITARIYEPITQRLECYIGMDLGLSIMSNSLSALDKNYENTRLGGFVQFETGLRFHLSDQNHIGISMGTCIGNNFDKSLSVPSGMQEQQREKFNGYYLSLAFGRVF